MWVSISKGLKHLNTVIVVDSSHQRVVESSECRVVSEGHHYMECLLVFRPQIANQKENIYPVFDFTKQLFLNFKILLSYLLTTYIKKILNVVNLVSLHNTQTDSLRQHFHYFCYSGAIAPNILSKIGSIKYLIKFCCP